MTTPMMLPIPPGGRGRLRLVFTEPVCRGVERVEVLVLRRLRTVVVAISTHSSTKWLPLSARYCRAHPTTHPEQAAALTQRVHRPTISAKPD
jgi:hypothetical protein